MYGKEEWRTVSGEEPAPHAPQHRCRCHTTPFSGSAPCDRLRIDLFAQGGIVRDSAWQGDRLDVFSQEPIGDNAVLKQLLSHEWVIAVAHL